MAKFKLKDLSLSKLEYGSGAAACAFDGHVRYVRITDITDDGSLASDIVSPSYYEEKHVLQEGDGELYAPIHYIECNKLTPSLYDSYSKEPSYKATPVRFEKCVEE